MALLGQSIDFSRGGAGLPLFAFVALTCSGLATPVRIFPLVMNLVRLGIFESQQEEF